MEKYTMADAINQDLQRKVNWYEKKYGPAIEKKGLGNWRNLFRKPTMYEWVILFMLVMALFIAWAYNVDIAACREVLENIEGICFQYCSGQGPPEDIGFNDNFTFTAGNNSFGGG